MSELRPERRVRFTVAYDGTDFFGWQVQPALPTIQGWLEQVLSEIEKRPVAVHGSGRTDAGVHALAQVAAATLTNPIPLLNLRRAMNRLLPPSIRILRMDDAPASFHPRFDAVAKTYEYRLVRSEVCSPFERRYVHHHPYPLDWDRVVRMAPLLEGEHDFGAFAAADEKDVAGRSKVRTIFRSGMEIDGGHVRYRVRGSGFLKHMVRNIVGTLIEAGRGNVGAEQLRGLMEPGCARKAGPTAPASGLFLVSVEYHETGSS